MFAARNYRFRSSEVQAACSHARSPTVTLRASSCCLYLILKFPNFSRMKAFYALCVIKSVIVFLAQNVALLRVRMRLPKGKSRSAGSLYAILTPRRQRLVVEAERSTTEWRRTKLFRKEHTTQWKTESRLNGNFGKHRVLENCGSVEDCSDCSLVHQKPLSSSLRVVDVPRSVYCVTFV